MNIIVKNSYLYIGEFRLKCAIGKEGIRKNKFEGDGCTPKGIFKIGSLYFRKDRLNEPECLLSSKKILRNFGWCDDSGHKFYNRLVRFNNKTKFSFEQLYRKDNKYDLIIVIKYNYLKTVKFKGSAIFIHLTKDYSPTKGCIALKKKDFLILNKLINKKTKIKIT